MKAYCEPKLKSVFTFAFHFLLFTSLLFAQSGGPYEIKRSVVANGGTASAADNFSIVGTIGQGAAGTYNGNGRYAVRSGFWPSAVAHVANGKIAFTSGGDIWKMDPDGSNRQLVIDAGTNDSEPAWSPDGSKIAFKSDRAPTGNGGIWVVNADGTGLTVLTPEPGFANAEPTWSPDGSKIAFHSNRDGLIASIYIMNPDGSGVTRLTNALPISDTAPEWSPDGTRIVFQTNTGIGVIKLDGTERAQIGSGQYPSWSPDGSKIVFSLLTGSGYHIYTMKRDGTDIIQITFGVPNDHYPSFSPDGKKIVFARNTSGAMGLWTMNADGSGQAIFSGTNTIGNGYSDWQQAPNTSIASPSKLRIDEAAVTFSSASAEGNTTFTPISPTAMQMPAGHEVCPTCPAYDISTTATYSPPVTVCLQVPSVNVIGEFNTLRLLHDEGGTLINRTISRDFSRRTICAQTTSLSPFIVAKALAPTAAPAFVEGRVSTADGRGVSNARVSISGPAGLVGVAVTNGFGYYRLENVPTGQAYFLTVQHKQFQFDARVISVVGDIADVDFVALPEAPL